MFTVKDAVAMFLGMSLAMANAAMSHTLDDGPYYDHERQMTLIQKGATLTMPKARCDDKACWIEVGVTEGGCVGPDLPGGAHVDRGSDLLSSNEDLSASMGFDNLLQVADSTTTCVEVDVGPVRVERCTTTDNASIQELDRVGSLASTCPPIIRDDEDIFINHELYVLPMHTNSLELSQNLNHTNLMQLVVAPGGCISPAEKPLFDLGGGSTPVACGYEPTDYEQHPDDPECDWIPSSPTWNQDPYSCG